MFSQGFSGPDFEKISALAFRIFLVSFRAQETKVWPISSYFSDFVHEQICFFIVFPFCLLSGWLPGDPRPFPNERSLNSHILCGLNLLIGQDLTHFYLTQSLGMHLSKRPTISARCVMKEWPPEKREGSFASVLVTESIDPLSSEHFPSFQWWPFHH